MQPELIRFVPVYRGWGGKLGCRGQPPVSKIQR